jgi:hypothetical protein
MSTCCNRICHMFHLDVAKVDLVLHMLQWLMLQVYASNVSAVSNICCKCFYLDVAYMLQWPHTYVASVRFIYFRCMLQVSYLDVPSVSVAYTYVASVYSKCFICFRRMLQVCLSRCCSCYTHTLQTYVYKCFTCFWCMLQSASCCNISRRRKRSHVEAVPTGIAVPMCTASEAGVGGPHLHAHQQA